MIRQLSFLLLAWISFIQVNAQIITLTSPNGGENLYTGKTHTIRWTSENLSSAFVKLDYSVDNGDTWLLINNGVNNTGSYSWAIPTGALGTNCLLRVSDFGDASVYDASDAVFSVQNPFISLVSPSGGEALEGCSIHRIEWELGGVDSYTSLHYSIDEGANWIHITDVGVSTKTYNWSVPSVGSSKVRLKVSGYYAPGINAISSNFAIHKPANHISLTSPNGGESYPASSKKTITWTSTGTVGNISLRFSKDGGATWSTVTSPEGSSATNIANTGSFDWLVPANTVSANCLIQIYEHSKACNIDYSDNFFSINNNPAITIKYPVGGERLFVNRSYTIQWSASNLPTNYVSIDYSIDNGQNWLEVTSSSTNNGSHNWTIPNTVSTQCLLRVRARDNAAVSAISAASFTIAPPFIKLTSPVGGENLPGCGTFPITWQQEGVQSYVSLYYSLNGGLDWMSITDPSVTSGTYNWTVPSVDTDKLRIKISGYYDKTVSDSSASNISITQGENKLALTSPIGGESWTSSTYQDITWTSTGTVGNVSIRYSTDGGANWGTVSNSDGNATNIANTGSFTWLVPNNLVTSKGLIRIYEHTASKNCVTAFNDAFFTLNNDPAITITTPAKAEKLYGGRAYTINWGSSNLPTNNQVKVEYSPDNGDTWMVVTNSTSSRSATWNIPRTYSDEYRIKVSSVHDPSIHHISEPFTVTPQVLTLTSPTGGENLPGCGTFPITWQQEGVQSYVSLYYSLNGGLDWMSITDPSVTSGTYNWTVPSVDTDKLRIKISGYYDKTVSDSSASNISITQGENKLALTSPIGGESWTSSTYQDITWTSTGTVGNVSIRYSTDGGANWGTVSNSDGNATNIANTGSFTWLVPNNLVTEKALIRVYEHSKSCVTTFSDGFFTLNNDPAITITTPAKAEKLYGGRAYTINWGSSNLPVNNQVKVEYSPDNGNTWIVVTNSTSSRSISWNVPRVYSEEYRIKVSSVHDPSIHHISEPFTVTPQVLTLTSPAGGENLPGCGTHRITWQQEGVQSYINIYYSVDGGNIWHDIVSATTASRGYYDWTVPSVSSSDFKIKLEGYYDTSVKDSSAASFTVSKGVNTLTLLSPNGGEVFSSSMVQTINWSTEGSVGNISLQYSTNGGVSWNAVRSIDGNNATNIANTGSFDWLTPNNTVASNCLIKIYEHSRTCVADHSDNYFSINNDPVITITTPKGGEELYFGETKRISWNASNLTSNLKLEYSTDNGSTWNTIADNRSRTISYYDWIVPQIATNTALVRVSAIAEPAVSDVSDATFKITTPVLNVLTPNTGNENWIVGENKSITWSSKGLPNNAPLKIEYSTDNGSNWNIIESSIPNSGSYIWTIPNMATTSRAYVKISSLDYAGSYDSNNLAFTITKPIVGVTVPNDGQTWYVGESKSIQWSGLTGVERIKIEFSADGGLTYSTIVNSTPNTDFYYWNIPYDTPPSDNCLIRISAVGDESVSHVTEQPFTIAKPTISLSAPNGGENWYLGQTRKISWTNTGASDSKIKIEYSSDDAQTWNLIALVDNTGSYDWKIASDITPSEVAYIRISNELDASINDQNDLPFSITRPSIRITSPNGGETLYIGQAKVVTWIKDGAFSPNVKIEFSEDNGVNWKTLAESIVNNESYTWNLNASLTPGDQYLLKISDVEDGTIYDITDASFKVSKPTITITYPNGGELLYPEESKNIRWQSAALGASRQVKIEFSGDNGDTWEAITASTGNNGSYSWKPDRTQVSSNALIRISDILDPTIFDISNTVFSIGNPSITITSPLEGEKWYQSQSRTIKWSSIGFSSTDLVSIALAPNPEGPWTTIVSSTNNSGSYNWTVAPGITGEEVALKIASVSDITVFDIASFAIRSPRPGDTFEDAILIADFPYTRVDTTSLYSNQFTVGGQPSADIFHRFTVPAVSDSLSFSINANFQALTHILSSKDVKVASSNAGYNYVFNPKNLLPGNTYYLVVEGHNTSSGRFTLTINNHTPASDLSVKGITANQTEMAPNDLATVSWEVENVGAGKSDINWKERIYIQSTAGEDRILIKEATFVDNNELLAGQTIPRSEQITIPSRLNIDEGVFVVELIPGATIKEVPDGLENNTGIQQIAWTVRKALSLELSATEITEGASQGITAKITRTGALNDPLSIMASLDQSERLAFPSSITIPAGQAATTFQIIAPDNDVVEGTVTDTLQFSATGFQPVKAALTILDNDKPSLTIANLPTQIMEGETVTFAVATNLISAQPLQVFLTSNNQKRFPVPASVIIPAGSLSADVTVALEQDEIPEIDVDVKITLGAANHHAGSKSILVKDDDVPSLELIVHTGSVSESGGPFATQATLRRTAESTGVAFKANLSASLPNTLIFPASISLAAGENEKTFTIGVVDNDQVDGDRAVEITAAVFVNSCGCSAPPTSSGSVSAALTVTDNDGPTLSLKASELTLPEGFANAGSLRITRNTPTNTSLLVYLTSSNTDEATVPVTVTIPEGKAFVDVSITTIDDGVTDGNKQVYFHATADGFSTGSVWVMVTDQNLPDLRLPAVSVTNSDLQAKSLFTYQVSVKNAGFSTAPTGVLVRGYLSKDHIIDKSDILISEDILKTAIPAGQTVQIQNAVQAPNIPGDYKLIYWVNPEMTMTELLSSNNTSEPISVKVNPDYTATANVHEAYFMKGAPVPITGSALKNDGTAAANEEVEVYVITNGLRRTITATTDGSGNYSTEFVPLANEAGYYTVGASFPGMKLTVEQDNFNILGVSVNNGRVPQFKVILNDTLRGSLAVKNLSGKALSDFTLAPASLPNGAKIRFDTIATFSGNTTVNLGYEVTGSALSPGSNFEVANLQTVAQEGAIQTVEAFYYCQAPNGHLEANISRLDVSASSSKGDYLAEFRIVNNGQGSSGKVSISLPQVNWLTNVTPLNISAIASGDTALVLLKFMALPEVPFDFPIKGSVVINAENGNSLTIPFTFKKVSESDGALKVQVTNQFTYYTEDEPMVSGAFVKISNYFSGVVYAQGYTDASGVFTADNIPEGKHRISVEKDKHLSYNNTININPGMTTETTVFLNYQAITFNWTVVPTAIEDQYDITLVAEFETHVPMPVVTIDMPKDMPSLSGEEVFAFNVTLTNHGLIAARDVALNMPDSDSEYEFVMNYEPADLLAQQSVQVPVIMRRRASGSGASPATAGKPSARDISDFLGMDEGRYGLLSDKSLGCQDFAGVVYWYQCNISTGLWQQGGAMFNYSGRTCPGNPGGISGIYWGKGATGKGAVPNCASCPSTPTGPATGGTPVYKAQKTSCVECINSVIGAAAGCTGFSFVSGLSCVGGAALSGDALALIPCIPNVLPPPVSCALGVAGAIITCGNNSMGPGPAMRTLSGGSPNSLFAEVGHSLQLAIDAYEARDAWAREYFGDMILSDAWNDLIPQLEPYIETLDSIPAAIQPMILSSMEGYELPPSTIQNFFTYWNTSIYALKEGVTSPDATYPNIINWALVENYSNTILDIHNQAIEKDYASIDDMYNKSMAAIEEIIERQTNAVCATVKVQFSQQLTMTREAFEGTLDIFNGHPTDAMDSLTVTIMITDENGAPSNDLFEIQTKSLTNLSDITGTGAIASQQNGVVKFLFIPEHGAAPYMPKEYNFSGSVRYWDPYAQAMVTLPLSSVPLTVNPSPHLMLHYFMQRNILGDDPFTKDKIEPSVPAELAVMVENHGYGPAVNMMISSAQPEIIENEKGLAINFHLIGSNFQGQPRSLGVTDINFGTVPGLETRIGQWYFTSSLLGKFVSYEANVVHANSFGNPDLSLVKDIKIHELTKSIKAYGADEDHINDFLVNDIFDIDDTPDIIYFSQGNRTAKVFPAELGSFSSSVSSGNLTNTLTVTASDTGWNYIKLNDPGDNRYEIVSVTRSDGQVIPLDNAWLTFVTLPASRKHIYENKFHFVDAFASTEPVTYTVVWKGKVTDVPEVARIEGAPEAVSSEQVETLRVVFNKAINPATFTYEDLNLTFQGGQNIVNSMVEITQVDETTFDVDLSPLTTGNGFYNFTVQAADIQDIYGVNGLTGKNITWSQFLTEPTVQAFYGIPEGDKAAAFDTVQVLFNLSVDESTATSDRFIVLKEGVQLGTLTIDSVREDKRLFYLSGLGALLTSDGLYELRVDLPNIRSEDQVPGKKARSITLIVDNTGPRILRMETSTDRGLDAHHVSSIIIEFDETVKGFNTASVLLTRNGEPLYLNIDQLSNTDLKHWRADNLGMMTYHEGDYTFTINLEGFTDALGNTGVGAQEISWTVDRSTAIAIDNVMITPDLGFSDSDGITSGKSLEVVFDLNVNASKITIAQMDLSGESILLTTNDITAGTVTLPITLLTAGNTGVKVTAIGDNGGVAVAEKRFFVDQTALSAQWSLNAGEVMIKQIDTVQLSFSSRLLSDAELLDAIQFKRNGTDIPTGSLRFEAIDDTRYALYGLRDASSSPGNYELSVDLSVFNKHSSGLAGTGRTSVAWNVRQPASQTPVANAGSDLTIMAPGVFQLDGSASFDPDADPITYQWEAPEGITLTEANSATPSLTITADTPCDTYAIVLIVSDGESFSTDVVNVVVDMPASTYYRDTDGDGYGDDDDTIISCQALPGYATRGGDCDDGDPTIYPGADEIANGKDNNCDGKIDEDPVSSIMDNPSEMFDIMVYPTPSDHQFHVRLTGPGAMEKTTIKIYDNTGVLVDLIENVAIGQTMIIGEQYPYGLYMLEAVQGDKRKTVKIIKR